VSVIISLTNINYLDLLTLVSLSIYLLIIIYIDLYGV